MLTSLDTLHATAATPNGGVSASIDGRTAVSVTFAPGYFDQASATELERQLTTLAKLLFVARMKEYYRGRSRDFAEDVRREPAPTSARDHTYVDARARLLAQGGVGSVVELTCLGMETWTVRIDRQQLAGLDAESFAAAVARAAGELVQDQLGKARALKIEVYARGAS